MIDGLPGLLFLLALLAIVAAWDRSARRTRAADEARAITAMTHRFARPDVPDHASVTKGTTHVRHESTARAGNGDGPRGQRSPRRGAGRGDGDRVRGLPGRPGVAERGRVGTTVDPSAAMTADPMDDDRIVGAPW